MKQTFKYFNTGQFPKRNTWNH